MEHSHNSKKVLYKVDRLHCASCVQKIEEHLAQIDGILNSSVNFASAHAAIDYDPEKIDASSIAQAIEKIGYPVSPLGAAKQTKDYTIQLTIAALVMSGILSLEMMGVKIPLWLQIALASAVQFGPGFPFYVGTWNGLKQLSANMDTLVCLGTSAAYGYSLYFALMGNKGHLYFETSALLISFILLGRLLEARAKRRANAGMTALFKLQPKTARVYQERGDYADVPIAQMLRGALFLVRPGERVPVDATVTEGSSHVDEGMLTGESLPVKKEKGSSIYAGTLNQEGALYARAEKLGEETALGQIIRMVEEAQSSKAPIERVADRVTAVFVPLVLGIALLTFFIWWLIAGNPGEGLKNAVAVLVIACPCALGLATPTVIMVATGKAALGNILIKNAEVLETAQNIDVILLDKTGTVTEGKLSVQEMESVDSASLAIAYQLASHSEHPISKAIAAHLQVQSSSPIDMEHFTALAGKGMRASRGNTSYYLGSLAFIKSMQIDTSAFEIKISQSSGTLALLTDENRCLAYFVLADSLKKDAKAAVADFHRLGMKVYLLSGDRSSTAKSIAEELGVDGFRAELLPEEKVAFIREMKGSVIAMVGDGINDAPALALADVSFAIGAGTDVAMESASVILMGSELSGVGDTVRLARNTFQKIRQNLFFACAYNCLGIPIAAIGLLNPIIAGVAMALSSISVVTNALLLKGIQKNR